MTLICTYIMFMTYTRHFTVLAFQLPLRFFLFVLCGDVAAWGTKTHPLCPDCICKSKETKDKRVMSCTVNDRVCLSTWTPHEMHTGSGKRKTSFEFFWSVFPPADRLMKHRGTSHSSIQPKLIQLHTHPFFCIYEWSCTIFELSKINGVHHAIVPSRDSWQPTYNSFQLSTLNDEALLYYYSADCCLGQTPI